MKPNKPLKTIEYMELIRQHLVSNFKPGSNYGIAKALGIAEASVSRYMNGRGAMDDKTAVKVARYLNLPEIEVIVAANEERARDDKDKEFWRNVFRQIAGNNAAAILISLSFLPSIFYTSQQCILCKIRSVIEFQPRVAILRKTHP